MSERGVVLEGNAVEEATRDAQAAGAAAGVEVVELAEPEDLRKIAGLFADVWGTRAEDTPVSPELLRAFAHTGNYVAGAVSAGALVGASVGFLANGRSRTLHSHITGIAPDSQRAGIGYALKLHQRAWALARGLSVISWTFDPLVRRNAYFNLVKLGATATGFHVRFYGDMADRLNAGDESDRCEVTWELAGDRARQATAGSPPEVVVDDLVAAGAVIVLEQGPDGAPRRAALRGDVRLCWVPEDIPALRAASPETARAWRIALRETLGASIEEGLVASAMAREGWYLLERP